MHGVRRKGEGFRIELVRNERELLGSLCVSLVAELSTEPGGDEGLARLFPAAYDDDEAAAEYERLVGPSLTDGKVAALRRTAETAGDKRLDRETLETWLTALNDLRLVLGTRLGVTEDVYLRAPTEPSVAVFGWLTWLQSEVVEALASS
ncbi:MAG TPA: DUF2017 family protein [Gaiellaceae bacterium]